VITEVSVMLMIYQQLFHKEKGSIKLAFVLSEKFKFFLFSTLNFNQRLEALLILTTLGATLALRPKLQPLIIKRLKQISLHEFTFRIKITLHER
jgi:hypothetical protein